MPLSAAHIRLKTGYYNTADWNASTNPGGMGGDGHRLALIPPKAPQTTTNNVLTTDFATVAEELATGAETSATQAGASAQAAAASLASTQVVATAILGGDNVQTTSTSTLNTATGVAQPFQVAAGKAYMAGMPVRFAAQAPATLILDGRIETYNRTTGAGTFVALRADGAGSASAWNIMLIGQPVTQIGGYQANLTEVASLAQWQNAFIPTPGITDIAAAKRRVVTILESGVSAQPFTNIENFQFADRPRFTYVQTTGAAQINLPAAWQLQSSVTLSNGFWNGRDQVQILDMSSTVAVAIWRLSNGVLNGQVINYANPASPTLGTVTDLSLNASNFRAFRVSNTHFAVLTTGIGGGSYGLSGLTIGMYGGPSNWWSGYNNGSDTFTGNIDQAVFSIAAAGNEGRAFIPATRAGSNGTAQGWILASFHMSGVGLPANGNMSFFDVSGVGQHTSTVAFCGLHTGAVMAAVAGSNQSNQDRILAFVFMGVENAGNTQTVTYAGQNGGPGINILGMGACAPGSGAEAWIYFSIPTPGNTGVTRCDYITISRSGTTLTPSAATFDTASPANPSWNSLLGNGAIFDGYPGHRYAYRRGGSVALDFAHPYINALENVTPPSFNNLSNTRALCPTASNSSSNAVIDLHVLTPPQAVLASGSWQAGDVGQTLYMPNGTARIASISGTTANLDRATGNILARSVTTGSWTLSPLLFTGGMVTGTALAAQAIATGTAQLSARHWKEISALTPLVSGTVYMLVSFDGRRTWRMASGGTSRIVASNRAADHGGTDNAWYSRTTGTTWTGPKADMLTAIRDGVMAGSANQAAPAGFSSTAIFNQAGWVAGWNATFDFALVLANASSSVDSLTLSYSTYEMFRPVDGASVQLRTDDPEGVTVTRIAAGSSSTLRIHVQY